MTTRWKRSDRPVGPGNSVILERPNIYVLPTGHGVLFGVILLAMLAGSINYNNSLGYAFTFLLASVAAVSVLHTYRNVAGLSLKAGRAPPTFAGGKASFEILVTNVGLRPRRGIRLQIDGEETGIADIRPRQTIPIILNRKAERRGVMPIGRFSVATHFPLGLFRGWSNVDVIAHCMVYPRPGPRRPRPEDVVYSPETEGSKGKGTGDFVGFREYAPGDSLKHVYWKALARGQDLVTKQFGGGDTMDEWLDWAQVPGAGTEARLSQLCRWVLDAYRHEKRYGLRLPGTDIGVSSGEGHKHRCLEALARF
jgi:uncharacterized protein (DUF58 family)